MPLGLDALTQMRLADDAGAHDVEADLVVGCDGRGSSVRTRTGLGLELSPEQYDVLWWKQPSPAVLTAGMDGTRRPGPRRRGASDVTGPGPGITLALRDVIVAPTT